MKIFEEQYTAWIDGKLEGAELATFERELKDRPDAEPDRSEMQRLGQLLRTHSTAPLLSNADFLTHQIAEQIGAGRKPETAVPRRTFWTLPRLAWLGAGCLLIGAALFKVWIPNSQQSDTTYFARILSAEPDAGQQISVQPVYPAEGQITFLWIDGLVDLPPEARIQ